MRYRGVLINDPNSRMRLHCRMFHEWSWPKDRNGEGARWRSLRYSNRRTYPDALDASDQPSQIRQLHVPLCWQT